MQEEWKVCVMNAKYEVSNLGRLRYAETKHVVNIFCNSNGYISYTVHRKTGSRTMYIHKAVALTFLGPRPKGCVIDHIDKNRANNRVDNLRYITYSENSKNTIKKKKVPVIISVDGLDELIQEYDTCEEAYSVISKFRARSVTPTMKNGIWACKTYE